MRDTDTGTLTGFLLARIAEDEVAVGHPTLELDQNPRWGTTNTEYFDARVGRDRWLAECTAKRQLLDALDQLARHASSDAQALRKRIALPYAYHPGYRPEWRVNGED